MAMAIPIPIAFCIEFSNANDDPMKCELKFCLDQNSDSQVVVVVVFAARWFACHYDAEWIIIKQATQSNKVIAVDSRDDPKEQQL